MPAGLNYKGLIIEGLCATNDGNEFSKDLKLKLEHQGAHATLWTLISLLRMTCLYKCSMKREIILPSSYSQCRICFVISPDLRFMIHFILNF